MIYLTSAICCGWPQTSLRGTTDSAFFCLQFGGASDKVPTPCLCNIHNLYDRSSSLDCRPSSAAILAPIWGSLTGFMRYNGKGVLRSLDLQPEVWGSIQHE